MKRVFTDEITQKQRYGICKECEFFSSITKLCSRCQCLMPLKVKFPHVRCPENKWIETGPSPEPMDY